MLAVIFSSNATNDVNGPAKKVSFSFSIHLNKLFSFFFATASSADYVNLMFRNGYFFVTR